LLQLLADAMEHHKGHIIVKIPSDVSMAITVPHDLRITQGAQVTKMAGWKYYEVTVEADMEIWNPDDFFDCKPLVDCLKGRDLTFRLNFCPLEAAWGNETTWGRYN
jgi:hypothetical protein